MWCLDHLDDLESDFSAIHHVQDIYSLPGPRFFRLALRIFAYQGVMAARVAAEQEQGPSGTTSTTRREPVERVGLAALRVIHPGLVETGVAGVVQDR